MVTQPTVLILGAGASIPFGFPSGRQLKAEIINQLMDENLNVWHKILSKLGFGIEKTGPFADSLMGSSLPSVDTFLENRPEFIPLGKTCIALALIPKENTANLYAPAKTGICSWYDYLWNSLFSPDGDLGTNKLSIITFNYDRSLEYFLFNCISKSYGNRIGGKEAVAELLKKVPIIHVHGQLGYLPLLGSPIRHYNHLLDTDNLDSIVIARDQIQIISEIGSNSNEYKQARNILVEAKKVFFIGFGFHEENMKKLKIKELPTSGEWRKTLMGTAVGLGESKRSSITREWKVRLSPAQVDILKFLEEQAPLD